MPLVSIEPKRLYRQIADQLRTSIDAGEFAPGARLPAERELAHQLGVSRPSVREALIALEVEGLVEVRMGSGIYVREVPGGRRAPVTAEPPLETIRARELIECELAARAALSMKSAQVRGLRDAIVQMSAEAGAGRMPTLGDRLFHQRIVEAEGNPVLTRIVMELYDERHNPLFQRLGSHFENVDSWRLAIAEHREVVDAIAAHDAAAAREAMSRHLRLSHDRFTASWRAPATTQRNSRRSTRPA